jgi:hypothetical protein
LDFARELDVVEGFLAHGRFRVAVIGGVALTAYGHPRMTLDLDVVTEAAAQNTLIAFMESQGFVTLHRSSGYSNHRHADRNRGRVDFMYVRGTTADKLFAAARELPGPGGRSMLVPRPEHLIAMKVQAMKDAPERTGQDLVDIAYLFRLDGVNRDECASTSNVPVLSRNGMSSPRFADAIDLERDVPTTADDVQALRRMRRETPSWFPLSPAELEALAPDGALDRHPVTRPTARPFSLP